VLLIIFKHCCDIHEITVQVETSSTITVSDDTFCIINLCCENTHKPNQIHNGSKSKLYWKGLK